MRLAAAALLCLVPVAAAGQTAHAPVVLARTYSAAKAIYGGMEAASDGSGGAIAVFRRTLGGMAQGQLVAQRVTAQGTAVWEAGGLVLSAEGAQPQTHRVLPDGRGGAFVAWVELREGRSEVRAQYVAPDGTARWPGGGIRVGNRPRNQYAPVVEHDFAGGMFVFWEEDSGDAVAARDLFGQRIAPGGRLLWRPDGQAVCLAPGVQQNVRIAATPAQGVLLLWEDFRAGTKWMLYTQQLGLDGRTVWPDGGLSLAPPRNLTQRDPAVFSDGFGGLFCVYEALGGLNFDKDLYVLRVNRAGKVLYHKPVCAYAANQTNAVVRKRGGEAWIAWEDYRSGNADVYVQKVDIASGTTRFQLDGMPVAAASGQQHAPRLEIASIAGDAVVAWDDRRTGKPSTLRAQRLSTEGQHQWPPEGVPVADELPERPEFSLASNEQGGLWLGWTDAAAFEGLPRLQQVSAAGQVLLPGRGAALQPPSEGSYAPVAFPAVTAKPGGGGYVAWEDTRAGSRESDIYVQRVDGQGRPVWRNGGLPVCVAPGRQSLPVVAAVPQGVYVGWIDRRNHDDNLYLQFLDTAGRIRWRADGVALCLAARSQNSLRLAPVGTGGEVLAVWVDGRNFQQRGFDLYQQRVNPQGQFAWPQDGRALQTTPGYQTTPQLLPDQQGGAYVLWSEEREGVYNVAALHVDAAGEPRHSGMQYLNPAYVQQRAPAGAVSRVGALFAVWSQAPKGAPDSRVQLQALNRLGGQLFPSVRSVAQSGATQEAPQVLEAGADILVAWLDGRQRLNGRQALYAQLLSADGQVRWDAGGVQLGALLEELGQYAVGLHQSQGLAVWEAQEQPWPQLQFARLNLATGQVVRRGLLAPAEAHQRHPRLLPLAPGRLAAVWVEGNPKTGESRLRLRLLDD